MSRYIYFTVFIYLLSYLVLSDNFGDFFLNKGCCKSENKLLVFNFTLQKSDDARTT